MGLETGNTINDLNENWPLGTDPKSQGDDHIRLIKSVLKNDAISASVDAVFENNVTVQGAFTSRGIDDNATATAMTIDTAGNVGIGTSSPDKSLHVVGIDGETAFNSYGARDLLVLENNGNVNMQIINKKMYPTH